MFNESLFINQTELLNAYNLAVREGEANSCMLATVIANMAK
jgi:hypothetical protein